jgi:hypothetical protein
VTHALHDWFDQGPIPPAPWLPEEDPIARSAVMQRRIHAALITERLGHYSERSAPGDMAAGAAR